MMIGQSIRRRSRRVFKQIANVTALFQEIVTSIRIVKAFSNEQFETERFRNANMGYFKMLFRANRLNYMTSPMNETVASLIMVVLLWIGGQMVFQGNELSANGFIRYIVFLLALFNPLKELSKFNNEIQTGMAAAERIFNLLEEPQETYLQAGVRPLKTFEREICYEQVSFRYQPDLPDVLKEMNLTIHKGEMVALVGPSGAGKSTLVDLLPRFYNATSGVIRIDGIPIQDFNLESLRSHIGVVTQDTILFNDTVRRNIAYGIENIDDETIITAAKIANAWDFIQEMENGLDTIIGERGIKLSGGQKQRLSIARAVVKNPPILILDEATSSLDTESEKMVQAAIDNLMQNRTVIAIAHRLSTIIHAHQIVVLNQGRIVDIGPHSLLLGRCPDYQRLYAVQFSSQAKDQ